MTDRTARQVARDIAKLEDSFCNPMKLKYAQELRDDLRDRGYSDREIKDLMDD